MDLAPKFSQFSATSHSEKTKLELDTSELRKRLFAVDLDPKKRPLNGKTSSSSTLTIHNLRPIRSVKTQTYDTILIKNTLNKECQTDFIDSKTQTPVKVPRLNIESIDQPKSELKPTQNNNYEFTQEKVIEII